MIPRPLVFALASVVCLLAACRGDTGAPGDHPSGSTEPTYIGIAECRGCHLEVDATYVHTGMGRSWDRMTPQVEAADFRERNLFEHPRSGLRYRMSEQDGSYRMRQFMLDSRGREIAVDEHELVYAVGSANHNRGYAIERDGALFQSPVCWYPEEQRWYLCPGFEHDGEHFSRAVTESCVFCHNGRMELEPGSVNRYREPFPMGIDCERCHGPGSRHADKWSRGGAVPSGGPDPTIVNPARLPLEQRKHVCFQCHLGDSKATHRVERYDRSLLDYRPGQYITEVVVPFRFVEQVEHDFGLSAQADRMLLSRCYTESGGRLECLTCHNPHVTVYRPERDPDFFRDKCIGCHAVEDCTADDAARAATPGLSDDCVACHMRTAQPDDLLFSRFTDHWIRREIEGAPRTRRRSLAIEPVFPERFAELPEADRAFYRGRANLLMSLTTPGRGRAAMWEEAERSFREAIAGGLDTDQSWFFLGKILGYLQRPAEALEAFRAAQQRNPSYYDAAFALGQALGGTGNAAEAAVVFERMLETWPGDAGALAELGRFRLAAGRIEEAAELWARAIEREPYNAALRLNRGNALARLGRFPEAAQEAEHAVRLDPDGRDAWDFYTRVMEAAGRPADAAEGRRILQRL